jgi:HlyD family secretion protein
VLASIDALSEKTLNVSPQIRLLQDQLAVQQTQLENLLHEKKRTERLVKADAATGKQLDDINAQVDVVRKQMKATQQQITVQRTTTSTSNRGILSERKPLEKRAAQLEEQLSKSKITNPIKGVVITKYAEQGEMTSAGKALYKIADLSVMTLRAYVTGIQLAQIRLNQPVKVLIDKGKDDYKPYSGTIVWVSDKAEFTPKTVQTKEERANLVYAVKIKVPNDGFLKIGMFGEVRFM